MDLQGKVIAVLPAREGTSARGPWKSQEYVIETHDQYPKKMVFNVFGADRIEQFAIKAGDELNVSFDIDAHEYNGRWFNNIRAWNVQRVDATAAMACCCSSSHSSASSCCATGYSIPSCTARGKFYR